jgi:uncharacterized membrane protein YkoI
MLIRKTYVAAIFLVPLTIGLAVPALAEENEGTGEAEVNETQVIMNAKIGIADAIRAAETESKGKAAASSLNDENGAVSYQVEVLMPDGKRTDVFVDLDTGKVLKMAAEENDEGNQQNDNGENGEEGEEGND